MGVQNGHTTSEEGRLVSQPDDAFENASPTRLAILRTLFLPVYLNVILCQAIRGLVLVALPLHILDLGGDSSDVGAIASAYGLGYLIVNIPGGWLLAVFGPKLTLLVSCAMFAISAALAVFAERLYFVKVVLGLSGLILGAANSSSILVQQTIVGNAVAPDRRGLAMSTMGGLSRLGIIIGPLVAGTLRVKFGTVAVFLAQIIVAVLAAVSVTLFTPGPKHESDAANGSAAGCQAAREAVRENCSTLMRVIGLVFALQGARKARELFFALAGRDIGLSADRIGQVTALSYALDMAGFPVAGRIMDSCGRKVAGILSLALITLGLFVLLHRTIEAALLFAILTGIGNGLSSGLVMTLGSDLSPSGTGRGPFLSVYRSLANISELIAPAMIGFLAHIASLPFAEMVATIIGLLGVGWITCFVPETLVRTEKSVAANSRCCSGWRQSPSQQLPRQQEAALPAVAVGRVGH